MVLMRQHAVTAAVVLATATISGAFLGTPEFARAETMATTANRPPALPPVRPRCDPARFRIAVDVGHTAEVPGARSARGAHEYDFNLRLAKRVEHDLIAAGFARTVLMVTAEPPPRGLAKRVRRASTLGAGLLLSIHHDSVPDKLLETWTYEGEERRFSDRFRGHSIFISNLNARRRDSLAFAHDLGLQLKAHGLQYTTQYTLPIMGRRRRRLVDTEAGVYRFDRLVVLKDSRIPAVLLEAGSIINRDEELLMATPEHQTVISAAIAEAAKAYCAEAMPRAPAMVRRRAHRPHNHATGSPSWWPFGRR